LVSYGRMPRIHNVQRAIQCVSMTEVVALTKGRGARDMEGGQRERERDRRRERVGVSRGREGGKGGGGLEEEVLVPHTC
jgi:hypothetical protein